MRKAPVIMAALAAASFFLVLPSPSEALPRRGKTVSRRAPLHSTRVRRERPRARARETSGSKHQILAGGRFGPHRSRRGIRKPRLIHQVGSGEVVLDSMETAIAEAHAVITAEALAPEATDATPPEAHLFPQPPCPGEDPVIEAHVHLADAETPEKLDAEEVVAHHDPSRITRIARRLGSFFRPKSGAARVRPHDVDLTELLAENFQIPVEGVDRAKLRDSFLESRGQYARHLAIDIGAPRGTPILATADGEIVKLTRERRGGITIYQKDASGRYLFFYCHLSRYARGLRPGHQVEKGDVIGYVGATGHVIGGPHLHFSITRLPEENDNLREGLAINPYLLFLAGVP